MKPAMSSDPRTGGQMTRRSQQSRLSPCLRDGQREPAWMAGFGGLSDLANENRRISRTIEEEFETQASEGAAQSSTPESC